MELPPTFAAEQALNRQSLALSVIKQSADQAKAIAQILEQSISNAPVSGSRGTNVNFSA
jgi:hypothetical protein